MARYISRRMVTNERGAEALEFALVVPLFLLLVFGVVDFGYMTNRDTMINNASREGAREGSLNPVMNEVKCAVRSALTTIEAKGVGADCLPSPSKITVTVTCRKPDNTSCSGTFPLDATSGGTVIVTVDYVHSMITPVGTGFFSHGLTLSKTTEMRIE